MSYDETFIPDYAAHDRRIANLQEATADIPEAAAAWRVYLDAKDDADRTPFSVGTVLDDGYLDAQSAAHAAFAAWERVAERAAGRTVWHEAAPATVGRLTAI